MAVQKVGSPDLSDAVVHLTRERTERNNDWTVKWVLPAFEVLKEIITSGVLRGSGNEGYVKGSRRAVCFSDLPALTLPGFAPAPPQTGRYRPYGIVLGKATVFQVGGRPVIYLPDREGTWIPAEEKWRHVRYEHGQVDFTHEREWRFPEDLDLRTLPLIVLVWSEAEKKEVKRLKLPLEKMGGIFALERWYEDLGMQKNA